MAIQWDVCFFAILVRFAAGRIIYQRSVGGVNEYFPVREGVKCIKRIEAQFPFTVQRLPQLKGTHGAWSTALQRRSMLSRDSAGAFLLVPRGA